MSIRLPIAGAGALLIVAILALGGVGPVAAQTATPTPTPPTVPATNVVAPTPSTVVETPGIIPQPNSGRAPRDPGDRGGWWQEALFFSICAALLAMAGLVWRDSRKQRRRQGRLGAAR